MAKCKIATIGLGKISQDRHLPVIDAGDDFAPAAAVSSRGLGHKPALPVWRLPHQPTPSPSRCTDSKEANE